MKDWRWRIGLGLGLALAACWLLAGTFAAADAKPDVRQALGEMATLESQIEQAQQRHLDEEKQLLEASRSLATIGSNLKEKSRLKDEGSQVLSTLDEAARRDLETLEELMTTDRESLQGAREAITLSSTALLAETAAPTADPATLLGLALLQSGQRDRALLASRRILRSQTNQADLLTRRENAADAAQYHTIFSQLSLNQLRQRHKALARQVAELQSTVDQQSKSMHVLASRHDELRSLIAQLVANEAQQATPTPEAAPGDDTAPPRQVASAPGAKGGAAEVPYEEGAAPMVTSTSDAAAPAGADRSSTAGTRHLFWRARPVGVRALAGGKVIFSGPFAGYRHLIIVDHDGGWRTLYGNLTDGQVPQGQAVLGGQELGRYQADKDQRADPFWFEVRQGILAVDPQTWPALPSDWEHRIFMNVRP